jgi:hypothetical protein
MGFYRQRNFGMFDATKQLVAGRQMSLLEHELGAGDPIPMEVDEGVRRRLWMVEHAHYEEDYTPTPEMLVHPDGLAWMDPADGVAVTEGDNGWYEVKADWKDEAEKVHGEEAARSRVIELREAGDDKGVTLVHTGGGWYSIAVPGLDEPVKVKGLDAATVKAQEYRDAIGKPEPEPIGEPVVDPPVEPATGEAGEGASNGE